MSVEVKDLCFSYGSREVLRGLSFSARQGDLVAVLGPNGVGKSTLFHCMLGFLRPQAGEIRLNGQDIQTLSSADMAKNIAYIPQNASPVFNYTVLDAVLMGLSNSLGLFQMPGREQREKAWQALESLGIAHLAGRGCQQISGGERQLMLIARALVQDARILIMDEPTASLDYGNSFRVMQRIGQLGQAGYTVLFSTHEPNQAFRYASRVLAMKDGQLLTEGAPKEVLTGEVLSRLYHIAVAVRETDVDGASYYVSIPHQTERKRP